METTPTPKRRGRPRKAEKLARQKQRGTSPDPQVSQIKLTPITGGPTDSVRREGRKNRGKPPKKYEPDNDKPIIKKPSNLSSRKINSVVKVREDVNSENKGITAVKKPDVNINLAVNNKQCLPHLKNVGMYILYFCKKCVYQSKKLSDITDHLASGEHCVQTQHTSKGDDGQPDEQEIEANADSSNHIKILDEIAQQELQEKGSSAGCDESHGIHFLISPGTKNEAAKEECSEQDEGGMLDDSGSDADYQMEEDEAQDAVEEELDEHNYADEEENWDEQLGYGEDGEPTMEIIEQELEGEVPESYKRRCSICSYTRLYSEREQDEHSLCHGTTGKGRLHCYLCKMDGKSKCLVGVEWYRLKAHLVTTHGVNFELQCSKCEMEFESHRLFTKHYRSHRVRCEHCNYDTGVPEDLELHVKCHKEEDPSQFMCVLCGHQSESQPGKWSLMHTHLVIHHPGTITPLFRCTMCTKGFQVNIILHRIHTGP